MYRRAVRQATIFRVKKTQIALSTHHVVNPRDLVFFGWGWRLLDFWPIRVQDRCPGMVFWAKSLWSLYGPIVSKSYKTCDLVGEDEKEDVAWCTLRDVCMSFIGL